MGELKHMKIQDSQYVPYNIDYLNACFDTKMTTVSSR